MEKSEIERKDARENPWYVLMTIAGEQEIGKYKPKIHEKNRKFWNGFWKRRVKNGEKNHVSSEGRSALAACEALTDSEFDCLRAVLERKCSINIDDLSDHVSLDNTNFREPLDCSGFVFPSNTTFNRSVFKYWVNFEGALFCYGLDMFTCRFRKYANFNSIYSSSDAHFQGSKFRHGLYVIDGRFEKAANFTKCTFCDQAIFQRLLVFQEACFGGSEHFGKSTFDYCNFSFSTDFRGVKFFNEVSFYGASLSATKEFQTEIDFSGAEFHSLANFSKLVVTERTTFEGVNFVSRAPIFYESDLNEDTNWTGAMWPNPPRAVGEAIEDRQAYERLKWLMDRQKKTHDEQMFHRMELRCREVEDGPPRNVPSRLYGMLAEYGWSFARPGIALGLVVMLGWMALGPVLCWGGGTAAEVSACSFRGLYVSVSNTFGFLGLWRLIPDAVDLALQASVLAMIVKVVQAVLGPVFLFFVLLALRNRYRMR